MHIISYVMCDVINANIQVVNMRIMLGIQDASVAGILLILFSYVRRMHYIGKKR